ncbi:MAG: hypothetical protein ACRECH_11390 [Nitrososphaerales archaeon]
MMKKKNIRLIVVIGLVLVGLTLFSVVSFNASQATQPMIVSYADPLIGNPTFVVAANGFVAKNGFAYSYVETNMSEFKPGEVLTMRPSLNVRVPSASNFTAEITNGGYNTTSGTSSFDIYIPSIGYYGTTSGSAWGTVADGITEVYPAVFMHFAARPTSSSNLVNIFLYFGPLHMPNVVSLGY